MRVDKRGYLYIGKKYANQEFFLNVEDAGEKLHLERVVTIPAKDAWFFDPDWQQAESVVQQEIEQGKTKKVKDVKKYLSEFKK